MFRSPRAPLLTVVLLLATAGLAFPSGGTSGAKQQDDGQATAQLRVFVKDDAGEPVEAVVQALAFDPEETVEQAIERGWRIGQPLHSWEGQGRYEGSGGYTLTEVPAGRVWVAAFAPGYFDEQAAATIELTPNETHELTLTVTPARRVTGRVVDAQGSAVWLGDKEDAQRFGYYVRSVRLRASYPGVTRPAVHEGETLALAFDRSRQQILQRVAMHTPIELATNVDGQIGAYRLDNLDPNERVKLELTKLPHGPVKRFELSPEAESRTIELPDPQLAQLRATLRHPEGGIPDAGRVTIQRTDRRISMQHIELDKEAAPLDPETGVLSLNLPAGSYELHVEAPGVREARAQLDLAPAESQELTLDLGKPLPAAVRVVEENGEPLAGAKVEPVGVQTPWSRLLQPARYELPAAQHADEHGALRFAPLPFAGLLVRLAAPGYESRVVALDLRERATHTVALAPARTGRLRIVMEPLVEGQALEGRRISLRRDQASEPLERVAVLDAEGRAEVEELPLGTWQLRCPRSRNELQLTVSERKEPTVLRLGGELQEMPVEFRFTQGGEPLRDVLFASIQAQDVTLQERIEPNRDTFTAILKPGLHELYVGTSNRRNLFPGDPVRFWRIPVEIEGSDTMRGTQRLTIDLPARTVRGVVRDAHGEPVPWVTVAAVPATPRTGGYPRREEAQRPRLATTTDAEGRYTLRGLSDEAYQVWARRTPPAGDTGPAGVDGATLAARDTEQQKRGDPPAETLDFTLTAGGTVEVALADYPPLVQDTATVMLRDRDGHVLPQTTSETVHGRPSAERLRLDQVPPGRYTLAVQAEGHALSMHSIEVARNETVRVAPEVEAEATLLATVTDDEGEPVVPGHYRLRTSEGHVVTPLASLSQALYGPFLRAKPHRLPVRNLPPGTYELEVYDLTGTQRATQTVELHAGHTTEHTLRLTQDR